MISIDIDRNTFRQTLISNRIPCRPQESRARSESTDGEASVIIFGRVSTFHLRGVGISEQTCEYLERR